MCTSPLHNVMIFIVCTSIISCLDGYCVHRGIKFHFIYTVARTSNFSIADLQKSDRLSLITPLVARNDNKISIM